MQRQLKSPLTLSRSDPTGPVVVLLLLSGIKEGNPSASILPGTAHECLI